MTDRGRRDNVGKLRWGLMPWDALSSVAGVLMAGAEHYGPRNWEKGLSYEETYESLMRHAVAWFQGEDTDPESGRPHMAHVACNALFLLAFELRGMRSCDDRPRLRVLDRIPPEVRGALTGPSFIEDVALRAHSVLNEPLFPGLHPRKDEPTDEEQAVLMRVHAAGWLHRRKEEPPEEESRGTPVEEQP